MTGKLKILAVVCVLLLVAVIAKRSAAKNDLGEISEQLGVKPALGEDFLVSKVTRIEIYAGARPKKKIILALKGNDWILESHSNAPANFQKIENFLETLKGLGGQLRITDEKSLKGFYLAQDPQASLFEWQDFQQRNFHEFLARLKSGGRYLFSIDGKYREEFKRGLIPQALLQSLKVKGYELSKRVKISNGKDRWSLGKYFVQKGKKLNVYLSDPMSDYLRRRLLLIRELLKHYRENNYPANFAMFVVNAASNNRNPMAPYLRAHLQQLNIMCKADVTRHLEFYLQNPNGSKQVRQGTIGILDLLLKCAISEEFNKLLKAESIYDQKRFSEQPPKELLQATKRELKGAELIRVNRLLLESVYPQEIVKSHRPIHVKVYSEKDPDHPSYHLLIGKRVRGEGKSNASTGCFVRSLAVGKVYEVGTDLRAMLMAYGNEELVKGMTLFPWLAKVVELKPGELDRIERITLRYPDKTIALARVRGKWQAKPEKFPLRKDAVQYLINQLDSFEPMDVVNPKTKLDWQFLLEFSTKDSAYEVLGSLPEPGGNGYCKRKNSPIIYKIWSGKFSEIFCKGTNLFNFPTLTLDASKLKRLKLITPQGEVSLERSQGSWSCPKLPLKVRDSVIKEMLASLAPLAMDDFAASASIIGLENPRYQMILNMQDGSEFKIDIGAASPVTKGRYLKSTAGEFIGVVSDYRLKKMFPKYRLLFVLEPIDANIDQFTFEGKSGYSLQRKGEKWTLTVESKTQAADLIQAKRLAKIFSPLVVRDLSLSAQGEDIGEIAASITVHASAKHRIDFYRLQAKKDVAIKIDGYEILYWLSPQIAQTILRNADQYRTHGK